MECIVIATALSEILALEMRPSGSKSTAVDVSDSMTVYMMRKVVTFVLDRKVQKI